MSEADEVLTAQETADLLKVSLKTVYRLAESGGLPGRKVGRSWRFYRRDLVDAVREGRGNRAN